MYLLELKPFHFREGQYESSYQIGIVVYGLFWIPERKFDWRVATSLATSFFTVGKAGTENLLTFGDEDKMAKVSLLQKLKMVAIYSPVFALTTFFRVGCLASTTFAAGVDSKGFALNAFRSAANFSLPLVVVVPLVILLLFKYFLPMVSLGEVVQGALGEITTITVWGKGGREESRSLQLGEPA